MNRHLKFACVFILLVIMLLIGKLAFCAEGTAQPMSLQDMLNQAVIAAISAFLLFVTNYARTAIQQYKNSKMHERGYSVVENAFWSALNKEVVTRADTLRDPAVRDRVFAVWESISLARLNNLAGFKKADIKAWVQEQQDIIYQKLNDHAS